MAGFPCRKVSGEKKKKDLGTSSNESKLDVLSANSNNGDNGGNCMKNTGCISYISGVLGWISFIASLSTGSVLSDLGIEPWSDMFSNDTSRFIAIFLSLFASIAGTLP